MILQSGIPWWRRCRLLTLSLLAIGCLLAVLLLVSGWGAMSSGADDIARRDKCQTGLLTAHVETARLGFEHRGRMSAQVQSDMTVKVPDTWPYARDLTLGEDAPEYQNAMSCLLLGSEVTSPPSASGSKSVGRDDEWRFRNPRVTAWGDWIRVDYQAFAWIESKKVILVGPWEIDVGGKGWHVALKPPNTLEGADWEHVEVDLGGLGASTISPEPESLRKGELLWERPRPLDISVDVDPPWQRYLTSTIVWVRLSTVGVVLWWLSASLVLAVAAVRALPRTQSPAAQESGRVSATARRRFGEIGREFNQGPKGAVLYWAVLSAAFAMTLILLAREIKSPSWRDLIGIAAGLTLILAARPWCRSELSTARKPGAETGFAPDPRRRQACAVTVAATVGAALGVLAVAARHLFRHGPPTTSGEQHSGHFWLVLLGLATLWLGLAAMTAWAWRFVREGDLARDSWIERWDRAPVQWVTVVSALLAVAAAVTLSCFIWAKHRDWKRVTWPSERTIIPDGEVDRFLGAIPLQGLNWVYSYSWVLAGIALVALLHIRVQKQHTEGNQISLGPEGPDFLLTAAIFAFTVGLRFMVWLREHTLVGTAALWTLWFMLIMFSIYSVSVVGRRWSVLNETDQQFLRLAFGTPQRRRELLDKAHEYRNWHHQIYLMEHGHANGDTTREEVEQKLRGQGRWISEQGAKHPAEHYSVVDIALAWGPEPHWWDNARHAAKLAFLFGIPASIALVWLTSGSWLLTLHKPTGLLDIVANLCTWQIAWAAAGMALGALWRVLPGRHSPVRALSLTMAYALAVGVGALLSRITDTKPGYALLHVLLMLTVLTLTSLWMDMSTFSGERQFWPSRFGLLLSVYQMRGISAHIAYILAQMAAAATIWAELARSVGSPG
ncbi:DUF6185 family protein [Streptomyces sp. NPDC007369]|uniref:DUF6185 family protein n=1 Tax=Streptomyces sp. NPDC007369 TaxID=3154589 RepID=UPI003401DF54